MHACNKSKARCWSSNIPAQACIQGYGGVNDRGRGRRGIRGGLPLWGVHYRGRRLRATKFWPSQLGGPGHHAILHRASQALLRQLQHRSRQHARASVCTAQAQRKGSHDSKYTALVDMATSFKFPAPGAFSMSGCRCREQTCAGGCMLAESVAETCCSDCALPCLL